MKITEEICTQLLNCPIVPPECGGIIGSDHGDVITHVFLDQGRPPEAGVMYIPNTQLLNQAIEQWSENGIQFRGIFHTHTLQWAELSQEDRVYIIDIVNAMPPETERLYFPLVFPGIRIKSHIARKNGSTVDIVDDDIEIIKKEEDFQSEGKQ